MAAVARRCRRKDGRGRGRQVAGNIGNILFFQDCGIKYLPRRNKSYVAVRSHLGGNGRIPMPTILAALRVPSGASQYTKKLPISLLFLPPPQPTCASNCRMTNVVIDPAAVLSSSKHMDFLWVSQRLSCNVNFYFTRLE